MRQVVFLPEYLYHNSSDHQYIVWERENLNRFSVAIWCPAVISTATGSLEKPGPPTFLKHAAMLPSHLCTEKSNQQKPSLCSCVSVCHVHFVSRRFIAWSAALARLQRQSSTDLVRWDLPPDPPALSVVRLTVQPLERPREVMGVRLYCTWVDNVDS
ncbi:hypothetical protein GN956_G16863 [Arapaima gigas]